MAKTYTLTEVADILEVDPKSLRRWIEIEKWNLDAQTTPYDKRVKFLTADQVEKLAKAHERAWPPKPRAAVTQAQAEQGLPGAVKLLEGRVSGLEASQLDPSAIKAHMADQENRLAELERKYSTTLQQLTDALLAIKELQDSKPRPGRKARTGDDQGDDQGEATELEPGLVSAAAFAQAHGVNVGTAKSAWQSGRVPTVKGSWRVPGVRGPIQIALDAQGQARFYELYHDHDGFTACSDCPHGAAAAQGDD